MKIKFHAPLQRYLNNAEKTGWRYIHIPEDLCEVLHPGVRKSYRVKGFINDHPITQMALTPLKGGGFILPIKSELRRILKVSEGEILHLVLQVDESIPDLCPEFAEVLAASSEAKTFFEQLPISQRNYFRNWVQTVKSSVGRRNKSIQVILALEKKWDFGGFMDELKRQKRLQIK